MTTLTKETVKIYATCYVLSNKLYLKTDSFEITPRNERKRDSKETKSKRLKKNPEDNLGNVIAEIDTDKIGRDVDYDNIKMVISAIVNKNGIGKNKPFNYSELFTEENITNICKTFGISIKELIETLMEHEPEVYNISFIRKFLKPFMLSLRTDKSLYEQFKQQRYYRPIFEYF